MSDTIELLNAIGQDATLRRASADELADKLEQAGASEALRAAVMFGDSSRLAEEFGHKPMYAPQITQSPGNEDDESDQDGDEDPSYPSTPEHSKPSSPQR